MPSTFSMLYFLLRGSACLDRTSPQAAGVRLPPCPPGLRPSSFYLRQPHTRCLRTGTTAACMQAHLGAAWPRAVPTRLPQVKEEGRRPGGHGGSRVGADRGHAPVLRKAPATHRPRYTSTTFSLFCTSASNPSASTLPSCSTVTFLRPSVSWSTNFMSCSTTTRLCLPSRLRK